MKITEIKLKWISGKKRLKAVACIIFDYGEMIVNDVLIIQTDNRMCVDFPQHDYGRAHHMELIVLNKAMRNEVEEKVLSAYREKRTRVRFGDSPEHDSPPCLSNQ